jgi:hypothetical protein
MLYGKHTMLLHPMSLHMVLLSYVRPSARCSCRPFVLLQPIVFSKPKRVASPHHHYAPCRLLDLSCQVYERLELHYCFFYCFAASWAFTCKVLQLPAPESCHQIILSPTYHFHVHALWPGPWAVCACALLRRMARAL